MRLLWLAIAVVCLAQEDALSLFWRAQSLENAGRITEAWLLYSQAALLEPGNRLALGKATQLRAKALEKASISLPGGALEAAGPIEQITAEDLAMLERLKPPPALAPRAGPLLTLDLKGDGKEIFTRVFTHFGIDVIFDGDYEIPRDRHIVLTAASFAEAVYTAGLVTNSFVNPLSPWLALVARDTDQKRREQERNVAITLPIPTAISSPEAQDLGRAIQQIFELQKVSIDTVRGMLLVRDRWSKVKYAELMLSQLLHLRGQVMLDVELHEVNDQSNLSYGFALPTSTQLIPLVRNPTLAFRGATTFGLGVTGASLFASMTHTRTSSLYSTLVRSLDGLAASVHIGDRFPIITQTNSFAGLDGGGSALGLTPQIQFEDLGLTLKITPHLHPGGEISLEVESEFKVLTGESNNDIPVIATRKYTGTVRLKQGQWAVASGLITQNVSLNRAGLAGLSRIPVLGAALSRSGQDRRIGQTLLVIRPRGIGAVPAEFPAVELFTGSETRFLAPVN
ncbi:MAG: type II secretion system protein GspD [Acidobacteriota bacterium]